jgi:hypothetical protein
MDFSESTVCCIKSFVIDLEDIKHMHALALTRTQYKKPYLTSPGLHFENFLKLDILPGITRS